MGVLLTDVHVEKKSLLGRETLNIILPNNFTLFVNKLWEGSLWAPAYIKSTSQIRNNAHPKVLSQKV